jgi:iron uptake system EfeUOB component EfeO/EfeM
MAEVNKSQEPNLKYLGLVHALVLQATAYLAQLYAYAKESSGPLKPGVDNVEGTVKTVVGPVYQKIEGKPLEILQYVDSKVDETLAYVDGVMPQYVKETSYKALDVAKQAPDAARAVVADVQSQGLYETASSYYERYEPVAEQFTYAAWQKILTVPYMPQVVHTAAPAAKFGAQQYNNIASVLKGRNVPLSAYIPLVPIERIEEASRNTPAPAVSAQ